MQPDGLFFLVLVADGKSQKLTFHLSTYGTEHAMKPLSPQRGNVVSILESLRHFLEALSQSQPDPSEN